MSDGGYSRIEKDFLGNERMVHYDGSGNMIGASDVIREPDGTIRIPNDSSSHATELPDVQAVEPKPRSETVGHIPPAAGTVMPKKSEIPLSQTVTYVIGTFVAAMLLTLGVLAFRASQSGSGAAQQFQTVSAPVQRIERQPTQNVAPTPSERLPDDPKPRNDEPAQDAKPYDQGSPDSNTGDDSHPKINDPVDPPPTKDGGKGSGSNDPIDLRGDDDPKKGPTKGDPNDIH